MDRRRLLWYSVISSTGVLVFVLPHFVESLYRPMFHGIGLLLFVIARFVENPNLGNEPMKFGWADVGIIAVAGIFIWLINTELVESYKAGIEQVISGLLACLWSARIGYIWGKVAKRGRRRNA